MDLRIRTLGGFRAYRGETELSRLADQPTRAALLVFLALEREATRDQVQGILWSGLPPDRARHSLSQALYLLRRELGDDCVTSEGERLRITPHLRIDARAFQRAAQLGRTEEAMDHYSGPFLEGWSLRETPEFEQWTDRTRARLERLHRQVRRTRLEELEEEDDPTAALAVAQDWVRLDPTEDEAHHALIDRLARAGRRADALDQYEAYRRMLAVEGLAPLDETVALIDRLRAGDDRESARPARSPSLSPDTSPQEPRRREKSLEHRAPSPRTFASAAVLLVVVALFSVELSNPSESGPTISPDRVLVYPLENRTGDQGLDAVGALASDWIAQGLASVETVEVVPAGELLSGSGAIPPQEAGAHARRAARATGSGTLVTGAYYRTDDGVAFQAQILSAPRWEIVRSIGPVLWTGEDPFEAVDVLRQRVVVQVAVDRDRSLHGILSESEMPPSYPAYLAYVEGFRRFARGDFRGAAGRLLEANEISPEFTAPLVIAGFALIQGWGDYPAADSVARVADGSRDRLPRYDRLRLDLLHATLEGDHPRAYEAVKEAASILPGGTAHYAWAQKSLELNRPREALEVLSTWDATREGAQAWMPYWDVATQSHHLLGEHRAELRAARRARDAAPDRIETAWFEVRALAAVGRVRDLLRIAGKSVSQRWTPILNPGRILLGAAEELRAHGFDDGVDQVLARFHTWFEGLPPDRRSEPSMQAQLGRAYYLGARTDEARRVFEALHAAGPANAENLRHLGTLAALSGDREAAAARARAVAALDGKYRFGRPTLARAAIAARLGDRRTALSLLQTSVSEGVAFGTALHSDPDLLVLDDDPSFRAFMRPEG